MRVAGALWAVTVIGAAKFYFGFSSLPASTEVADEETFRLISIFSKNKYGYNTRFMSDFDEFLQSALNDRWIADSTAYYNDEAVSVEI